MRGLPGTAPFAVRLLCYSAAWALPTLLLSADAPPVSPSTPVTQDEPSHTGDQAPAAVAELLSLIEQLNLLRVTTPYIDHHDEAVAAQTDLQRRRRKAGLLTKGGAHKNYDHRKGWSERSGSSRSRSLSSNR